MQKEGAYADTGRGQRPTSQKEERRRGVLLEVNPAGAFISNCQPPELWEKKCLLFEPVVSCCGHWSRLRQMNPLQFWETGLGRRVCFLVSGACIEQHSPSRKQFDSHLLNWVCIYPRAQPPIPLLGLSQRHSSTAPNRDICKDVDLRIA